MSGEKPFNPEAIGSVEDEKQPIKLTREEYDLIANTGLPTAEEMQQPDFNENYDGNLTDEVKHLLESKGITLNSGPVKVEVDGEIFEMQTEARDLGTTVESK